MIAYRKTGEGRFEIEASGRITHAEILDVWSRLEADMPATGGIRVLEIVDGFEGIDAAAIWEDLKRAIPAIPRVERAAIVADQRWVTIAATIGGLFVPAQTRTFARDQLEAARAWIAAD